MNPSLKFAWLVLDCLFLAVTGGIPPETIWSYLKSVFLEHVGELCFIVLKNPEYTHTHTTKSDFCTNSFGMGIMVSLRASPRVPNKASQSRIFGKNGKNPSPVPNPTSQSFGTWEKKSSNARIFRRLPEARIPSCRYPKARVFGPI